MGEICVMDDLLPYVGTMELRQGRGQGIWDTWKKFESRALGGLSWQRGHTNPHNFCSPYPLHEHWVGICRTEMTVYRVKDILKTYSDDSDSKH